jgi:hypothetical protein
MCADFKKWHRLCISKMGENSFIHSLMWEVTKVLWIPSCCAGVINLQGTLKNAHAAGKSGNTGLSQC